MEDKKEYHKQYCRMYYYENREKILEGQRIRRQNPEWRKKMKKYYREYYRVNREKILQQSRHRRNQGIDYSPKTQYSGPIVIKRGIFKITFD